MEVINSQRLYYRLLGEDDAELFAELDSDPEVMRFINGGKPHSLDDIKIKALPRLMAYTDKEKGHGMWGVFTQDDNEFVGWILVRPMNFFSEQPELDNLEIGWRFMRKSWGKGFGTESAKQVTDALIAKGGITALSAIADPENTASIGIMKKIGLQFIKQYIHQDSQLGDIDVVYYQRVL